MFPYTYLLISIQSFQTCGFPCWVSSKESTCQCRRHMFDPWSGKILQTMEQPLSPGTSTESVP